MGNPRTRRRQLQRVAERRMAERRRRRQRRVALVLVLGILGLFGVGSAAALFLNRDRDAGPSPTGPVEAVACGGERPAAAGQAKPTFDQAPEMQIDRNKAYRAVMETSCGTIEIELFADDAPVTVNSFTFLARQGFYDGLIFHRVIAAFMNQGGDPKGDGTGGPGYQFEDEIAESRRFDRPGLLAMANSGPDSNGSQFFITVAPARHLDGLHTIFGRVVKGMEVVQEINALATDAADRPNETVYIERIRIEEQ